jgi:PAS domain S-box-containing protein
VCGAAAAVAQERELRGALQAVADQARLVVRAKHAALCVAREAREQCAPPLAPWVFSGLRSEQAAAVVALPTLARLQGGAAVVPLAGLWEDAPRCMPDASCLCVPVTHQGRHAGDLYLSDPLGAGGFTADDARALELFAQHAALAVDLARERERARREGEARRRDAEGLRASEARFRHFAEHARDVVYRWRIEPPGVDYVSPAIAALTGYAAEDFRADPTLAERAVHAEDRETFGAHLARGAFAADTPFVLRLVRRDGAVVWTEHRVVPVHDDAGALVAIEGIARDVTDRKRAELDRERLLAQLEAERRWLRAVVDRCPVAVVLYEGPAGERATANHSADELFGCATERGGGPAQHAARFARPGGGRADGAASPAARALAGATLTGEELSVRRDDGGETPVLVSAGPIRDATGRVVGAVLVADDITAMKELERLREEWTSIVAHDLRQPINAVAVHATVLASRAKELGEPVESCVRHLRASARMLDRMVTDLLDVSRIDAHRLRLERQALDLPALLASVVERAATDARDHPVRVAIRGSIPRLSADPQRLEQALGNLLSNAIKYGYAGTQIDVDLTCEGDEVRVSVANQGDGIPSEELPRLFARFHRGPWARKRTPVGLGLGLYITRWIVEAHGGRIWAESAPGESTTFRFSLPLGGGIW